MATHPRRRRWTYEEFARLPEDGNRYEVIAGELYVTPAPRPKHQEIVGRLIHLLSAFVDDHGLGVVYPGPIDVLFAEGDYLEPDVIFVRKDRREIVSERGIEAAPDLVVEVLSESTADRDRGLKRERYAAFVVPEYWIVDPDERRMEICRQPGDSADSIASTGIVNWQPIGGGPVLTLSVTALLA